MWCAAGAIVLDPDLESRPALATFSTNFGPFCAAAFFRPRVPRSEVPPSSVYTVRGNTGIGMSVHAFMNDLSPPCTQNIEERSTVKRGGSCQRRGGGKTVWQGLKDSGQPAQWRRCGDGSGGCGGASRSGSVSGALARAVNECSGWQ